MTIKTQTQQTQIDEFRHSHLNARDAWVNWVKQSKILYEQQKRRYSSFVDKEALRRFIAEFGADGGYKRTGVHDYLEGVYEAVFTKRRARTLEIGLYKQTGYKGEFKDKRLCFGADGFSMRYEHSSHARVYSFDEMAALIKNSDEMKVITTLLQNAKQHEVAMNIVQFATFLNAQEMFGEGIVAELKEPVLINHDFDNYSNKGNTLPRIADKIELDYIEKDEVHFNLFARPEKLESVVNIDSDDDDDDVEEDDFSPRRTNAKAEEYDIQRISVSLAGDDDYKDENYTTKMQIWAQLEQVNASMKEESDRYKSKFAKLKADVEAQFGRYLLMNMVAK